MKTSDKETKQNASHERILDAATELFAEYGYDGVSTRKLASEVGLSIATINYHVGSKSELYGKVIRRLFSEEEALIRDIIERFDGRVEGADDIRNMIVSLVDSMVDLNASDTARARLYMRRWLDRSDTLRTEEVEAYLALYAKLGKVVGRARRAGRITRKFDLELMLRSLDWMIYGYFVSGSVDLASWHGDPLDNKSLKSFKSFLYDYIFSMAGLQND